MRTTSSIPTGRVVALALLLTTPALGCSVVKAIFGAGSETEEPEAKPKGKPYFAPPQSELSEAEWTALTETAEERARAEGATEFLEPLRLVGEFPRAVQTIDVKANHCYLIATAWPNEDYPTRLSLSFPKGEDGVRAGTESQSEFVNPEGGSLRTKALQACAERDGQAQIGAAMGTRNYKMEADQDRHDPVQWAIAVAESAESPEETEAREASLRRAEIEGYSVHYDFEKREYGEKIADVCHRCRVKGRTCSAEAGDDITDKQTKACLSEFTECTAPADLHVGKAACQPDF